MPTTHPAGQSVWQELVVPDSADPAGLADFYRSVLGWHRQGDAFLLDGAPVAGLRVSADPGPGAWLTYLATDDLDASLGRVEQHGGKVVDPSAPITLPSARAAIVRDCFGACFGLAEVESGVAPSTRLGHLVLADVMTTDLIRGQRFYDAVLQRPRTHQEDRLSVYRDERGTALLGINELTSAEQEHLPAHVLPWFAVPDDQASAAAARDAGGAVATEGHTFIYGGWGVVVDPTGAAFKTLRLTTDQL